MPWLPTPNFAHDPREISAKNLCDARVGMVPRGELRRQHFESIRNVEVGNEGVEVVRPRGREGPLLLRALNPFAILAFPLRCSPHGSDIAIGSNPDMILPANFDGVFQMANDIDRHRLRIHSEI